MVRASVRISHILALPLMAGLLALSACEKPAADVSDADKAAALAGGETAAADAGPDTAASDLLDKLLEAANEAEAANIEQDIWDAWLVSGSATVDLMMSRGIEALEMQDLALARDMFDRAVLIRPDYSEAWNRRAMLFFNDGKYDEAIADLEQALKAEPRHFGAWIGLGMIFESSSEPAAALLAYRKALEVHPFAEAAKQGEARLIPQVEGRAL